MLADCLKMRSLLASLALPLLLGCGPKPVPSAPAPGVPSPSPQAAPAAMPPPTDALGADATYADLVRAARTLEGKAGAGAGCLLARRGAGFSLQAELGTAVRPLPDALRDLDPALEAAERVELLGAWGRHGDGSGRLALASFTTSPPTREAVALVLTDRGIALRGASTGTLPRRDALDLPRAVAALSQQPDVTVFVAAEAGVPLRALHDVLDALATRGLAAVLSVVLAPDTKLPPPASASARVERCASGLPETSAPEGSLPVAAIVRAVAPLKERTADCLARGDARGAAGGRIVLALRVNESGRVQSSCVTDDQLGDPGVATCMLELARGLSFPPPSPAGVLDIELPLVLRPSTSSAQRPVCTDAAAP